MKVITKKKYHSGSRKRWRKGSYTVEASFVIPFILGIIFAFLFLVFILHDKVVLQGRTEALMILDAQGRAESQKYNKKKLQKYLWVLKVTKVEREEKMGRLRVKVTAKTDWKIPIMDIFFRGRRNYRYEESFTSVVPDNILRWKDSKNGSGDGESEDKEGL